ncbi:MAG: UDP-N-acetylmuramate--L-alanine ligase [Clostridia bacterium]|nr:UDP-N-acetylmuramate--L-alanine ligase [Clostridia bacterium]
MALENTHFGAEKIAEMLRGVDKLFFAGIGGVSMCSLARISHIRGYKVSGYDRSSSAITSALEKAGIDVFYENDVSHIDGCGMLIYTVAIPAETPEYAEAQRRGIPCVSRADYLGYIMSGYGCRIGISGMHGKTTTTSMTGKIFSDAGVDPTISCGGVMKDVGSEFRIGDGEHFIFEACEYMDSFLDFYPSVAVVLNIEMDHVDYFHSMEQIRNSYAAFMDKTGSDGIALVNCCDDDVMLSVKDYKGKLVTFGVEANDADYCAADLVYENGCAEFDFVCSGESLVRIKLNVPGAHCVCDALAAAATAHLHGISPEVIAASLRTFEGAGRRMDPMGDSKSGAAIYSDYAHHPTEIATTLDAVSQMNFRHVYCVFQPHTYSRTSELFEDFANALSHGGIDEMIIAPIYSARETNVYNISGEDLCNAVNERGAKCRFIAQFEDIADYFNKISQNGDMLLVMGAGDITKVINYLQ